jgi:hypothetical protein
MISRLALAGTDKNGLQKRGLSQYPCADSQSATGRNHKYIHGLKAAYA